METWLREMEEKARQAAAHSYAPYSHFAVGAAVLAAGKIFAACNVENASYGLTCCAERAAVFQAVASGARHIEAVVIYAATEEPVPPCGACRQVLAEFGPQARVVSVCAGPGRLDTTVAELLPAPFAGHSLASLRRT